MKTAERLADAVLRLFTKRAGRCAFPVLVALLVAGAFSAYSQDSDQPQAPNLRVNVNLQSLAVRVTDKQGNDVRGLSADDFTILEEGRPQKIAFFGTDNVPTSLNVLVDGGGSMDPTGKLGSAESIAARFLRGGRSDDEISAMEFTDQMGPFRLLTEQQLRNPSSVSLAPGTSRGSALFDAIATVLCHLNGSKNLRQAVVVITDGIDQHSRLSLEELIGLVQSSRAQLFMIGSNSRPEFDFNGHLEKKLTLVSGHDIDNPAVVFDRLASESGAQSFFPTSEDGLERALKRVSDLLQAQYTLAYYPEGNVKRFRRIQVKVKRSGLLVASRRGVGSDISAGSPSLLGGTCEISPKIHPYPFESKLTQSGEGISYHEDFSDPRSGWPNHDDSRYVPSGYELSNVGPSKIDNVQRSNPFLGGFSLSLHQRVVAAYGPWWTDFRASAVLDELRSKNSGSAGPSDFTSIDASRAVAGLVFRMNERGYYDLLLSDAGGAKDLWFKLEKWQYQSREPAEIISWTQVHLSQSSEAGVKIAVECVGNRITVSLNGQQVGAAKDDDYDQGYVGFVLVGMGRSTFRDLVASQQ